MVTGIFVANELKAAPDNEGWVLSWGVVRSASWNLVGVYVTKDVVDEKSRRPNVEYDTAYGSHRIGSDDFVTGTRFLD